MVNMVTTDSYGFQRINDEAFRQEPATVFGTLTFDQAKTNALRVAREKTLKAVHDNNRAVLAANQPSGWKMIFTAGPDEQVIWDGKQDGK